MKRLVVCLGVAAFVLAALPVTKGARAQALPDTVLLSTVLSPSEEPDKLKGDDKKGDGQVFITFHLTRGAGGSITAATADFLIKAQKFPKERQLISAQIGLAPVGAVGPVVIDTGIAMTPLTNGSAQVNIMGMAIANDIASSIIANPQTYYFNIATDKNPNGAARGQLAVPATVEGALTNLKTLTVTGSGFQSGSIILINGLKVHTKNDTTNPDTTLTSKKGATHIVQGQTVLIQVTNPDGGISPALTFTRP